jgi:di/tricarboxylate transporter
MTWEAWVTVGVVILFILGLARSWAAPDLLAVAAMTLLVLAGEAARLFGQETSLPTASAAVANFGNAGLITVGVLFVVVAGLVQTGAMTLLTQPLLGRPKTALAAQLRLLFPVAGLSAFLNNTPVVAMFMPVIDDLCRKTGISASRLFMPMAFAATIGGICTLIGTSTNLILHGLILAIDPRQRAVLLPDRPDGLMMFDPAWIGLPCAVLGFAYMLLASRWLLPDRKPALTLGDDPRQYTVEMIVEADGPLVGRSIEEAGLRHLPGLYLVEIERDGEVRPAVGPTEKLRSRDRLVFVGIVESVVDLQRIRGLAPSTNQVFKLNAPRTVRSLIEAVVSDSCPLVGKSIREGRFRTTYNAAVLAVARGGQRIRAKVGDIVLEPGDTLLLEAHADFARQHRNSRDFFLVSNVENSAPPRHERAWIALTILVLMVVTVAAGWIDLLAAAFLAGGVMIATRCCTGTEARQSVDWPVLLVIGSSLAIGGAMESSGAAGIIAQRIIDLAGGSEWLVLLAVYFVTMLFTELITNNAAAVLVFPIALSAADTLECSALPFVMSILVAASAGFATPIGYQTNLMVYGPGGYRFSDYLRFGIPLNLLFMSVTVTLAPLLFPF